METEQAATFAVDAESVPPGFYGLTSYADPVAPEPRVSRRTAMQVPAVKRSRDLICGSIGGLPLWQIDAQRKRVSSALLEQPERNVPRSVTMTRTLEDLLFEQVAWWLVVERDYLGWPTKVRRLEPGTVDVSSEGRAFRTAEGHNGMTIEWIEDADLIRFDSPNDALLIAGARAIRQALKLADAAGRYTDGSPPGDYFTPTDGADPFDTPEELRTELLDPWAASRQQRTTAYIPAAVDYHANQFNPEQLELADQRQHAVLEIARVAGIDPEELGVSTTSRTYANQQDRRKAFLDFTLGGYLTAIQDRLGMGDVTPRGNVVRFNLSDFLRSDDKTRWEAADIGLRIGAITHEEVRDAEDKPPLTPAQRREQGIGAPQPPAVPAASEENNVRVLAPAAEGGVLVTFNEEPELRLDAPGSTVFTVDVATRTVTGMLVPYGKVATSGGRKWSFSKGTIRYTDPSRVKLWIQHDPNRAVGYATTLDDREDGLYGSFKVARGASGDEALSMAEDRVWDGFSVGIAQGGKYRQHEGVFHAIDVPLMETSLTPAPAFEDARVHSVAASAANGRNTMECTKCGKVHAAGVTECNAADVAAFEAANGPTFETMLESLTGAITQGFADIRNPQGGPEPVSPGEQLQVTEAAPYRFDGFAGKFSLVDDMRDAQQGNSEARQRLAEFGDEFGEAMFAVATTNVTALNPTKNRPELYVPNLVYSTPLWDMVSTGGLTDATPFTVPKFSSASGLVSNHTQGTEPTPGAFAATSQTITPGAMSGKVEINREVLDAGGNPKVDAIVWGEMVNAYYEAREQRIAAALAAVGTAELNLAGVTDAALVDALTAYFAGLQFVRGGNRFTGFAADGNLFPALVDAADTTGRKLLPILGPSNAQGTVSGAFDRVNLGAQAIRAAWALGAGNDKKSYNFVPSSVWAWSSAPQRFTFEYQVKSVDIAIWGYGAAAVLRDSDVKPIDYTTSDTP